MKTSFSLSVTVAGALLGLTGSLFAQPALTIYNQDFAVVRDELPLELKAGAQTVVYDSATATLEPDSVILRDPGGKVSLQILEQSYRNDPVTQEYLLSFFEGQELDFLNTNADGTFRVVKGKVIRSGFQQRVQRQRTPYGTQMVQTVDSPIIEVEGKLRFALPGQPLFPSLGNDAILRPRLEWKLNASVAGKVGAEVAYLTTGMSWEADYNVVAPEKGDTVDIIGWVTMENRSGKVFTDAAVKLMAGDVNKVQEGAAPYDARRMMRAPGAVSAPVVTEKAFDEYHLYTLQNPVTLRDGETKQVEFVRATGVKAKRLYIYDGVKADWSVWRNRLVGDDQNFGSEYDTKVAVVREFENTKENGLGLPLPKGKLRFYLQDGDRRLEFTGENEIDHTPRNETIRVVTGNAFDIVGERRRVDWQIDTSRKTATEKIEVKVRNRKDEPVEVTVKEHVARWMNWEITEKSAPFEKKNAQEVEFKLPLKPDEEGVVTYTVRYTW